VALAALDAHALELGDAEVRSALGENLDLRIAVTIDKGESMEPSCFTLAGEPATSAPRLTAARVSIERSAVATYLRVRTEASVTEPAVAVGIVASCPGRFAEVRRDYALLINPRKGAEAPAAVTALAPGAAAIADAGAPSAAHAPSSLPSIATLIARIGDTLESVANAIFPGNRAAKRSYIQALRETNPPLASLGERDPIPIDTPIALPDLRTFARSGAHGETQLAAASRDAAAETQAAPREPQAAPRETQAPPRETQAPPREAQAPRRERAPRSVIERPARPASAPAAREEATVPRKPAVVRNQTVAPGFVLKLSSGEMDLSPSKSVDDRMRAQLRDRQLVLDADDQVAAVLALRNSVRQLESRVAELQLKLAGMPSSFPAPKVREPEPAAPQRATVETTPPPVTSPAPESRPAPSPAVEKASTPPSPEAASPTPPPPVAAAPTPSPPAAETPTPSPPAAERPTPPPPAAAAPAPKKAVAPGAEIDWLYYGLWALAFLLVVAAIVLAMRLARRRREDAYDYTEEPAEASPEDEIVVALEPNLGESEFDDGLDEEAPAAPQRALDADVDIATRLPDNNTDDTRRRYIEERFPEIGKGAIALDDPDSVVKGARLFYEDGAIARAVELLQFAIEQRPAEVKSWLALFEIFRLEALKGEFAELARRFREEHGQSAFWRKVQYFGREIDPGNQLYAEKPLNTFETIGPAQAHRLAAESSFDPVAENWLGAPMDFQNEVLANELRKGLMAAAGLSETDLVPNPMPALRNVEMFTVA
jgi:tetratricopeptide (TPR) repeat protein